jgi:hypothetical protein
VVVGVGVGVAGDAGLGDAVGVEEGVGAAEAVGVGVGVGLAGVPPVTATVEALRAQLLQTDKLARERVAALVEDRRARALCSRLCGHLVRTEKEKKGKNSC